jgi:uncharacterized protein YcbK (DUF882 family)
MSCGNKSRADNHLIALTTYAPGRWRIEIRSLALLPLHLATSLRRLATTRYALTALIVLATIVPAASARTPARHKHPHLHAMSHMLTNVGLPGLGILADDDDEVPEDGKKYELKLARQGGEIIDVVYRVGDTYIPEALDKLSLFLHDTHNEDVKSYDPRTFDVLHTMLAKLDRSSSVIQVLCGYRTKETNDELRASGTTNAAEHSQHIEAKALDIRVTGIPAVQLRDAALSLGAGGVGYYPRSQFIHVDTGPVREWTFSPHLASHRPTHSRRHRG